MQGFAIIGFPLNIFVEEIVEEKCEEDVQE
jgi:hypothetical protein